jgi:hypothetical protein
MAGWKLMVSKVYDISTIKGLRNAEKYKTILENKYDKVETKKLGIDKIVIKGYEWVK